MANKKNASKAKATKVSRVVKAETKTVSSDDKKMAKTSSVKKYFDKTLKEVSKPDFLSALVVEFIGTFLLTAGVITTTGQPIQVFFILAAIVYLANGLSGAHVNPLITLGAWATRRISTAKMVGYIFVQVTGAMAALSLVSHYVSAALGSSDSVGVAARAIQIFKIQTLTEGHEALILIAEMIGAFIFAFAVANVTSNKKKSETSTAFGVAGGLFLALIVAGSLSNILGGISVLNPAVAFGLQAFTNPDINFSWAASIYVGAPLIGGVLGFALNSLLVKNSSEK